MPKCGSVMHHCTYFCQTWSSVSVTVCVGDRWTRKMNKRLFIPTSICPPSSRISLKFNVHVQCSSLGVGEDVVSACKTKRSWRQLIPVVSCHCPMQSLHQVCYLRRNSNKQATCPQPGQIWLHSSEHRGWWVEKATEWGVRSRSHGAGLRGKDVTWQMRRDSPDTEAMEVQTEQHEEKTNCVVSF